MKASHQRAHISPRKTRLVADMIRGQSVSRAKDILDFSDKRAAVLVAKVLRSAEANIIEGNRQKNTNVDVDRLVVQRIQVNEGPRWKVLFPRPRGVGATMTRPTCHIEVELAEAAPVAAVTPKTPKRKQGPKGQKQKKETPASPVDPVNPVVEGT